MFVTKEKSLTYDFTQSNNIDYEKGKMSLELHPQLFIYLKEKKKMSSFIYIY